MAGLLGTDVKEPLIFFGSVREPVKQPGTVASLHWLVFFFFYTLRFTRFS